MATKVEIRTASNVLTASTLASGDRFPVLDVSGSGSTAGAAITAAELASYAAASAQPLDSDLTAIAALATASYGRSLLTLASSTALAAEVDATVVDVARRASGGTGAAGSPYTGWESGLTPAAYTRYHFRKGYYSTTGAVNWIAPGVEVVADAGVYLVHDGTTRGPVFKMDAGSTPGSSWVHNVLVQGFNFLGHTSAGAGTVSVVAGTTAVVGVGTAFLSAVAVGDSVTILTNTSSTQTRVVTAVADDTNLTVDFAWTVSHSGQAYVIGRSTHGVFLRGVRSGTFRRIAVRDVGQAALWTEGCVGNVLDNFRVGFNDPEQDLVLGTQFKVRHHYGIVFAGRGADYSTCWTVLNPVCEGAGSDGAGIWLKSDSYGANVIGGTSEANKESAKGVLVDGTMNTFVGTDVEANTSGADFVVTGGHNAFVNCLSAATTTVSGNRNHLTGGQWATLVLSTANGGLNNVLNGVLPGTALTDGGNETRVIGIGTQVTKVGQVADYWTSASAISGTFTLNAATCGNVVSVTVIGSFTLAPPTNPTHMQRLQIRFLPIVNNVVLTWGSGWASNIGYFPQFPAVAAPCTLTCQYDSAAGGWCIIGWSGQTMCRNLTSGVAAPLVGFYLPASPGTGGGTIRYCVECSDGTKATAATGELLYAGVSSGTLGLSTPTEVTSNDGGGTLSNVFSAAVVSGRAVISLTSTATGFGTITRHRVNFEVSNLTTYTAVVQ